MLKEYSIHILATDLNPQSERERERELKDIIILKQNLQHHVKHEPHKHNKSIQCCISNTVSCQGQNHSKRIMFSTQLVCDQTSSAQLACDKSTIQMRISDSRLKVFIALTSVCLPEFRTHRTLMHLYFWRSILSSNRTSLRKWTYTQEIKTSSIKIGNHSCQIL